MLTSRRPEPVRRKDRTSLADVLDRPRFEVLPLPGVEDDVVAHLPPQTTVTVTASPRRGMGATVAVATRLAARGVHVVPHLSARLIADEVQLKEILVDLTSSGVGEVFVVGGDAAEPAGAFGGSLDVLLAMDRLGCDLVVGVAGYPEPHPTIPDDVTVQAMWDKRRFASYVVSQMCFDAGTVLRWVRRVRSRGVDLPIHVGVPGPASPGRLLRVSTRIGVGESARVLAHHGTGMLRLAQPGTWRPDALLDGLAPAFADPAYGLGGVHVYTFNAVAEAEQWRRTALTRLRGEDPRA